jgi:hypothetical protein
MFTFSALPHQHSWTWFLWPQGPYKCCLV